MKNRFMMYLLLIFIFSLVSNVSAQIFSKERAQKHFDRGMVIIENAQNIEDYEKAIKELDSAFTAYPLWPDPIYNLGVVNEMIEDYEKAKYWFDLYTYTVPEADDIIEVKSMINKLEVKVEQMKDPKTLSGIWYWSRPKVWCEPRLEIQIYNGKVEARALYSEGIEENNELNAERDPGVYIAKGNFVPIVWDDYEMKLLVNDAPYFSCSKSIDPEMCPSKATFNLVRKGKDRLEGKMYLTEKIYQDLNKPEIYKQEIDVVFERDEE